MKILKEIRNIFLNHLTIKQIFLKKERRIIIILILLLKLNIIISSKRYNTFKSHYSYITIKINGTGNIFSTYKDGIAMNVPGGSHDFNKPNEININGLNQSRVAHYYSDLNQDENTVKLIWNDTYGIIRSIAYLFRDCYKITEIDLSHFNASNVEYMEYMFSNCISLTSINFTNFYALKVTHMNFLFKNCTLLKELDLSNFVTNKVGDMCYMFAHCISLTSLNLSSFNTSLVYKMYSMFENCSSLKELDISSFETPKLNHTGYMFHYCPLLTSLDLSNFKPTRSINVDKMFSNCSSLNYLDISFFRFSNDYSYDMFSGSSNIKAVNIYKAYFQDNTLKNNIMKKIFNISSNIIVCGNSSFFTNVNAGPLCDINLSCMRKLFYINCSYTDFSCKTRCLNESYNNNSCPEFHLELEEINNDLNNSTKDRANNTINNKIYINDIFLINDTIYNEISFNETNNSVLINKDSIINDIINTEAFHNHSFINDSIISEAINIVSYVNDTINPSIIINDSVINNTVIYDSIINNTTTGENNNIVTYINDAYINNTINNNNINISSQINYKINTEAILNFSIINDTIYYDKIANASILSENNNIVTYINNTIGDENFNKSTDVNEIYISNTINNYNISSYINFTIDVEYFNNSTIINDVFINNTINNNINLSSQINDTIYSEIIYNYSITNDTINSYKIMNNSIINEAFNIVTYINDSMRSENDNISSYINDSIDVETFIITTSINDIYSNNTINNDNINFSSNITDIINSYKMVNDSIINETNNIATYINNTVTEENCNNSIINNYVFINNTINNGNINITSYINEIISTYITNNEIIHNNTIQYNSITNNIINNHMINNETIIISNLSNITLIECSNYFYYDIIINKNICLNNSQCPKEYNKKIPNKKQCINNCTKDNLYKYEHNNICYNKCPENTLSNKYYQCEEIINMLNSSTENQTKFVENIKKELLNRVNIIDINEGNDLKLTQNDILITFTSTLNQKEEINNKNKTVINLGECETKLKNNYNIPTSNPLYIFKLDKTIQGMKIPKIEYEVYYPLYNNNTLYSLDLSLCENMKIDIYIPLELNESLDKYNKSSDYYTNLCTKASSDNGADITINDRKNNFVENNMTLCEENCDLNNYDYNNSKVKCSCEIKIKLPLIDEISFDKKKLLNSFTDIKNIANLHLVKCYKEVFDKNGVLKNYGFFIFIFINVLFYISVILFIFKYYNTLKNQINEIISAKKNMKEINNDSLEMKKDNKSTNNSIVKTKNNKENKINTTNNDEDNNNKNKNKKSKFIKLKTKNKYYPPKKKGKKKKKFNKKNGINKVQFNTMNIINKEPLKYNDLELNTFEYKKALLFDKRSFGECYFSLLKMNHLLVFSFYCNEKDYNPQIIKLFLFFFFFAVHFTINALFFNDDTMHKIYIDEGSYNFIYQIPQIIYSSLISAVLTFVIKYLSLPEKDIIDIKNEKADEQLDNKVIDIMSKIKVKFVLFFIFTFVILLGFMFYISCFCGVYINTQVHLIKDSLVSFFLSLVYPLGIYIFACLLRMCSLKAKNKDRECLYKLSLFVQDI